MASDETEKPTTQRDLSRRAMLKGAAVGAAAAGFVSADTSAEAQGSPTMPVNPYGGGPSKGLQVPPYYKPTPSVRSRNNYFPGSETLGRDEMRISFVGSCPFPPKALQEKVRKLPGTVYRAKGVIYAADATHRRAVLQVVGRRVDISLEEEWGPRAPRSQIVAIGAAGGIDADLLESIFASCIVTPALDAKAAEVAVPA